MSINQIQKINAIKIGLITRFISHYIILLYLPINNNILKAILILSMDFLDCNITKLVKWCYNLKPDSSFCKDFCYQLGDKILDLQSYTLVVMLLKLKPFYLFLIFFRLIGLGLFYKTKNSQFLIFFPDLFKEILLFEYLFQSINPYIFILVFLKIIFEILWHTYINKNNYNNNLKKID